MVKELSATDEHESLDKEIEKIIYYIVFDKGTAAYPILDLILSGVKCAFDNSDS